MNSTFARSDEQAQLRAMLMQRLAGIGAGLFEVWVSHQINISAFTGEPTTMGEGLVVNSAGKVVGRSGFAA
jgi:hypothetical protein